jgi:alpha-tubulin suppressor-like RCC1 family protein
LGREEKSSLEDPEKIPQLWNIRDIAANGHHSLALDKEGNVWSWGLNLSSQLGDEGNEVHAGPQKIKNLSKIKSISAGYRFSMALREDGTVVGWGASCDPTKSQDTQNVIRLFASSLTQSGGYGDPSSNSSQAYNFSDDCQREKSTGIASKVPKQIANLEHIIKISSGFGHTLALKDDGSVWAVGCNKYGQIGNNTNENALEAVQITSLKRIKDIAAGYRHSLVLDDQGNVWTWGYTEKLQPTKIALEKVKTISAGYDYSLAVLEDGKAYGWGNNASKQISTKNIQSSKDPIQLDMINSVELVSAGGTQAVAFAQK